MSVSDSNTEPLEAQRLSALHQLAILDSPPDSLLDELTHAIADLCEVPIASISLVDSDRQWFKSRVGIASQETPRAVSFCSHAIKDPSTLMEVPDARQDSRFADNPLVTGPPGIVFYAGQPLITSSGQAIGTLCVIDNQPKILTASQKTVLRRLGRLVAGILEQQPLTSEDALLNIVTATLQHGVFIVASNLPHTPIIYCNDLFKQRVGRQKADILGQNIVDLLGPRLEAASANSVHKALATRTDCTVVARGVKTEMLDSWYELHLASVPESTGTISRQVGTLRDVTDRVRSEQVAIQLGGFFERSFSEIYVIDAQSLKFIVVSEGARRNLGYQVDELTRLTPLDLCPGLAAEEFECLLKPLRDQDQPTVSAQLRHRRKNGSHYPADVRLQRTFIGGSETFVAFVEDATERERIREVSEENSTLLEIRIKERTAQLEENRELLQAAKLAADEANLVKSKFLAAASHDIRQPLHTISLSLSLLERSDHEINNQAIIQGIRTSVSLMDEIVTTLLDISKLDQTKLATAKQDFEISALLSPLIDRYQALAASKNLQLALNTSEQWVHSDPALLGRIIENLLSNAIRYTVDGSVTVLTRRTDDAIRVCVVDTGIGIAPEALDRVFDDYYQVNNSGRLAGAGLGLGLAVARRIANILEHQIIVQSTVNEGSIFFVDLPVATALEPIEAAQPLKSEIPVGSNKPTVLFIDDDPIIRTSTTMLLIRAGIEVHSADCADSAHKYIEHGLVPDVIVSDYRLPGINGLDMVHLARKTTNSNIPAIIITGDMSVNPDGIDNISFVHKPIRFERLLDVILSLCPHSAKPSRPLSAFSINTSVTRS